MTLNIIQGYSHSVLKLSQYDKGYNVAATIRKGVEAYEIPTDYTVTVEGRKPDNTGYQYPATFEGDTVTFPVMDQMTVLAGRSVAEVVFYDADSVRVGTANFSILVEPAPINEDVPISETDLPLIAEAIQAAAEAQASASTATASATTATEAATTATEAATTATTSAESAEGSAEDSEAWAVGQRNGVDVGPEDETYQNNAKWYAEHGTGPSGGVRSVNGKTGVVILDAEDVGALPNTTVIPSKTSDLTNDSEYITETDIPVQSVNGKTGAVVLTASDVGALPDTTVVPTKTSQLQNDSNFVSDPNYVHTDNNFTTSEKNKLNGIESGAEVNAVNSVNGEVGDVTIAVPTRTSQLQNDSGFVTSVPVQSVNNKTGAVTLTAADVNALPSTTFIPTKTSELTNNSNFVSDADYVHTDNNFTTAEKQKLASVEQGAEVNTVDSVNGMTGAVTGLQTTANLVTSLSASSTDTQYPSAKCVYDIVGDVETLLASI